MVRDATLHMLSQGVISCCVQPEDSPGNIKPVRRVHRNIVYAILKASSSEEKKVVYIPPNRS